jgi:hypothetical protein
MAMNGGDGRAWRFKPQLHAAEGTAPRLVTADFGVHGADVDWPAMDHVSMPRGLAPAWLVSRIFLVHGRFLEWVDGARRDFRPIYQGQRAVF